MQLLTQNKTQIAVKAIVNDIETIYNTSNITYKIMLDYFNLLSHISFLTLPLKKGSYIFRSRYSTGVASFTLINDLSYPPKELVKDFSRLNKPYQSLFYASESYDACLSEMIHFWLDLFKEGEIFTVTIGRWMVKSDLKLLIIPDMNNSNEFNRVILSHLNSSDIEFWNYISEKFKTSTKIDKNIYIFTSAFANALLQNASGQNLDIDGIIYSSVQSSLNINIALNTLRIDAENIIPVEFAEIHVQKISPANNGLPRYIEIGDRKYGTANLKNKFIQWN